MSTELDELLETAGALARRSGFRSPGIYHLLRAVRLAQPELFASWLTAYQIEAGAFLKFLENVLRPRRAGGGVPRDRIDALLLAAAVQATRELAGRRRQDPSAAHLGEVLGRLDEDPIVSLCERYLLACCPPRPSLNGPE
jgi:hypothetical protein